MKKIVFFLMLISLNVAGQNPDKIKISKEKKDTIDYTNLFSFRGYYLISAVEKGMTVFHNCDKSLKFVTGWDSASLKDCRPFFDGSRMKSSDTMAFIGWYLLRDIGCIGYRCGHIDCIGKLRLNQKTDILVIEKTACPGDKKMIRLFFKVMKFSESEIKLEDLQSRAWHRLYTFRKS
ncbi:MAG: hypothetical protein ACXVP0_01565 [Bacteroidia bacterium]